ncbi:MAG TPA: hypothetical protein VNM90_16835 [Haliangium sp.]|nr:hypothetical protein [Haliangium sp.]
MTSAPKLFWSLAVCAVLFLSACLGIEEDYQIEDESYSSVVAPGEEPEPTDPVPICPEPVDGEPADDTQCAVTGYCCNTRTLNVSKTSEAGCDAPDTWHKDILACINNSVCGQSCRIN